MAKVCCNRKHCSIVLIISGVVLAVSIAVCVAIGVFNNLIRDKIRKNVELRKGSETYKDWQSPSSPVYMQYFMFNVTNPESVQNGSKPFVQQIGPYSYREIRHNVPVDFDSSSNTVKYLSQKAYVFDPPTSCGGCDPMVDKIFTINVPLLTLSRMLVRLCRQYVPKLLLPLAYDVINHELFKHESVFGERSIHELLWGYNDSILLDLKEIEEIIKKVPFIKGKIPPIDPLIHLQSNNTNISSEIHTGVGNIHRLGQYVSWNNLTELKWWGTPWANMINGTDASRFYPPVHKDYKLYTFVSDVCRSLYLSYDSTVTVKGITLYRFIAPRKLFQYTPVVKAGFCVTNNHTCVPDGLLDISVCQNGAPIVVSLPHFLFADPSVLDNIHGLHPNKEDHATFVSVEPNTGITMSTDKRIQINIAVDKVVEIRKLDKLRKLFLPVMFVNESALIDDHDADKFKKSVYLPMSILNIGKYVLIGFGCFLLIIGLLLFRFRKKQTTEVSEHSVQVHDASERSPLIRSAGNLVT